MKAGRFTEKMTVQKKTHTVDSFGDEQEVWTDRYTSVWCQPLPIGSSAAGGGEYNDDDQLKADTKYEFVSRYLNGVEYTDRIYWSGGYFDIYQIFPVGRREGMRIRASWSDNQDDGFAVGSVVTADPVVAGTGYTVSELIAAKDAAEAAEAAAVVAMNDAIAAQEAAEAAQAAAEAAQADAEADEAAALAAQAEAEAARDAALAAQAAAEAAQATAEILQAAAQSTADAALAALVVAQNDLAACEAELEQAELDLAAAQQAEADALTALGVAQNNEANALADLAIAEAERDEALQDELAAQAEQAAAEAARDAALADAGTAAADLAACEATLATTQADLATAQSDLAACEAALATAQSDLATAQSDLAACEAARDAALASIASLEADAGITIAEVEAQYEYNDTGKSLEYLVDEYNGVPHSLLDDYSGASAAFSLRRLDSTYTGPAVRVVRASDLEEKDIYFEADGSLDVSTLEAFCSGTSGTVKVWYDQSGGALHAEQTTASNQPTIVDTRTNLLPDSQDFTQWQNILGATLTQNDATAPDGTITAARWESPTSTYRILRTVPQTLLTNTNYVFSFYVRNIDATTASYRVYNNTTATDVVAATSYFSQISTSEWTRVELQFTTGATPTDQYACYIGSSNFEGEILFWGAQLEEGDTATPYITTSGSAVTVGEVVRDNGEPAVQFDGVDDVLQNSSVPTGTIFTANAENTVVAVMNQDGDSTSNVLISNNSTTDVFTVWATQGTSNNLIYDVGNEGNNRLSYSYGGATTFEDMQNLLFLSSSSALQQTYVNGTQLASGTAPDTVTLSSTILRVGSRYGTYMMGTIQELILYPSDQASNREGIETNVNEHYGIYDQPLLDQYSGSAAAYSLRRLSDDYTGPAVRVVRASDLAEADIYFEADGTLDVNALEAFCHGTSGTAKVWYDQSGLSNHAEQTTAANQPKIVDTRTNLLRQSNQFDTVWGTTNTAVTGGELGFEGSQDAWLLEADASASSAYLNQAVSISGEMTASIYAKEGTTNWFRFSVNDSGTNSRAWFDLSGSGAVGTTAGTVSNATIESVGNGYFKCSITFNATAANLFVFLSNADGSISYSVGDNIYIQNAQLETGSVATEYIPTSGSAITVGEVVRENGLPAMDFDGVNSYMEVADVATTQPTTVSFVATGDTANDYFFDGDDATDRQAAFSSSGIYSAYAGTTQGTGVSFVSGLQINMFALFDGTDGVLYLNGTGSDSVNMGTRQLSGLFIGQRYSATGRLDGRFQELIFWTADHSSDRTSIEANVNDYYTIYT